MRRKVTVSAALILVLIGALVTFQITYSFVGDRYQTKLDELMANQMAFEKLAAVDDLVRSQYVGAINEAQLEENTLRGYMMGLGDKGCSYLTQEELSEYLLNESGQRWGVGVGATYHSQEDSLYVYRVFQDSPAQKAGLLSGDRIVSVNGASVRSLGYTASHAKLYGPEGSSVELEVKRGENLLQLTVAYASIQVETVSFSMLPEQVGYVRIYSMNALTEGEFKTAVDSLVAQGARSLLFDLRSTVGGKHEVAVKMLDHLVSGCVLARTYTDSENINGIHATNDHTVDLPFGVMVNAITASSAELFAASLRDCTGAVVVGETTQGEAAVRTWVKLADLSGLVITTSYFAPPESESFHNKGLVCDVVASLVPGQEQSPYVLQVENDAQLQAALQALAK